MSRWASPRPRRKCRPALRPGAASEDAAYVKPLELPRAPLLPSGRSFAPYDHPATNQPRETSTVGAHDALDGFTHMVYR